MTLQLPSPRELAREPLLAGLAMLDAVACITASALRADRPDIDDLARPDDPRELAAARALVDLCEALSFAVVDYRQWLASGHLLPDADDRPF